METNTDSTAKVETFTTTARRRDGSVISVQHGCSAKVAGQIENLWLTNAKGSTVEITAEA